MPHNTLFKVGPNDAQANDSTNPAASSPLETAASSTPDQVDGPAQNQQQGIGGGQCGGVDPVRRACDPGLVGQRHLSLPELNASGGGPGGLGGGSRKRPQAGVSPQCLNKQPNPAELQLYPRATLSEKAARAILPHPTERSDVARKALLASASRLKARAAAGQDRVQEKVAINGLRRWEAAGAAPQPPEASDASATLGGLLGVVGHVGGGPDGVAGGVSDGVQRHSSGDGSGVLRVTAKSEDYLIPESNCRTPEKQTEFDDCRDSTADRLDRFKTAKGKSAETAAYLERLADDGTMWGGKSTDEYARDLRTCGCCLHFQEVMAIRETRIIAGAYCSRHLLCPFCAIRRSAKMLRRYAPLIVDVCNQRKLVPWLVTLTVKNGSSLVERIEHLRTSMRSMNKAASDYNGWKKRGRGRKRRYVEWSKVVGSVYAIEVTKNQTSNEWHPHTHYVAALPQGETLCNWKLSDDWKHQTGDSYITDVRPFDCSDRLADINSADAALDAMSGDLVEVLKYAVKFSSMPSEDVWEAYKVICGNYRLLGRTGKFFNHTIDDNLLDAPLDTGDLPYVLAVARYMNDDYVVERRTVYPQQEAAPAPF